MEDPQPTNANERRCKAETKRGRCRVTRGLNADSLCSMHSGTTDPRELGRLSGKRRREPNPARVHPGLTDYLRAEVHPERVWAALEMAMTGANESARVSASKVLLDALSEPRGGCTTCAERERNAPDIEKKLIELLARHEPEREAKLRAIVHEELAPLAEHVDVAQIEERLVARL